MKALLNRTNKSNAPAFLLCAGGILLNLMLNLAVSVFHLPVYLDTVGTIAVAVTGGYLPGVIVGFATNLIKCIYDPSALYYAMLNVLIAALAADLSKIGWHKTLPGLAAMTAAFTLIGGGLGSLIPWFMKEVTLESDSLGGILLRSGYFNAFGSHLLSSLILDLADKVVSMVLVLLLLRLIPERYASRFRLSFWLQKPVSEQELQTTAQNRVTSLRTKVLSVLTVSIAAVALLALMISMRVYHKTIIQHHTELAMGTANIAASLLDGDAIDTYLLSRGTAEGYREDEQLLENILSKSTDIAFLYVYKMETDGFHVVFDIATADTPADAPGCVIPYDDVFTPYLPQLLAGEPVEPIITRDAYGYLLTTAAPVYDSNGRCVCYAIADVDMNQLLEDERTFLVEMLSVFFGCFILICALAIWLTQYHVIYPIRSITKFADAFSNADASQEQLDASIRQFRELDIVTGDEIEKLYLALCSMTVNQAEQTRSIRRLSEQTTRMQDGLIITMADLVENRDSDTGAHVQKTAAYVKIIAEGLKHKGYYAEKLTPKFMSDVVRSAPLHDVGKINIPDVVLNKPGKLTDEEYEIMKTHTTAGRRIMEHAINTVGGDSYLKEARNMAAYHHERWDGKGYPEGLHGNVIPLSARIMAVADVFDALASPRVYKPAFPLEKAIAVLEEGKGTQFDPKCVEVFIEALPEVKEVLRKYQQGAVT